MFRPRASDPYVTSDFFGRADSSSLGVTDGVLGGRYGCAWTEHAGDWAIASNILTPTGSSPGGNGWYAGFDPGSLKHIVTVRLAAISGSTSGLCVRWVNAQNHYQFTVSTSTIGLFEAVSNVFTARGSGGAGTFQAGDDLHVDVNGSSLTWWVTRAGALISTLGTYASASQHTTATALAFRSTSTASKYARLLVRRR
jgi:hypothetical protein